MKPNPWWKDAVMYELYVDKFAGNFLNLINKLPYLKKLGINAVWILPHYPSPMIDGGYDISDYYSVRPDLGTIDDFKEFVSAAHNHEIRVIIDLVLNHVSTEHPWFKSASESKESPYRDYFLWSETGNELRQAYHPFANMAVSGWVENPKTSDYYFSTFFPQQADLNWDNPKIFEEALSLFDFWQSHGVDGFRLDAVAHLIKREGTRCVHQPEVHAILKRLRSHIDKNYPAIAIMAEAGGFLDELRAYFGNGDECHMVLHFPLMAAIYLDLILDNRSVLDEIMAASNSIPENCQWAIFLDNHDEINLASLNGKDRLDVISKLDPGKKYSFEMGRGASMRLASAFNNDKNKITSALVALLSFNGSPILYYGTEIGMQNEEIKGATNDDRWYVRGTFDWSQAEGQIDQSGSMFNIVASLIRKYRPDRRSK